MKHLMDGAQAEVLAKQYLESQGLHTVTTNYRCRFGEIDIIMNDQSQLVFIEVRFRKKQLYGSALHSIDWRKQQRIVRSASCFLQTHHTTAHDTCRFDVIAIGPSLANHHIDWVRSAFDGW